MKSTGEILPQLMNGFGLGKRLRTELICLHWRDIVGEALADHTQPGRTHGGVMTVAAKNAVWAHHLSTMREEIIVKINAYAGEKAVTDLKFQAGYSQNDQNSQINGEEDENPRRKRPPLAAEDLKIIDGLVAALQDEDLRHQFRRLLIKEATLRKDKEQRHWTPCPGCGVLTPPADGLCPLCRQADSLKAAATVRRLLREAPWLGYEDCLPYAAACRRSDYRTVRDELIDEWAKAVQADENDQMTLQTLAMILFRVQPQAVDEEIVAATLQTVRRKKHVSPSRV